MTKTQDLRCRECGQPARLVEREVDVSSDVGVPGVIVENMLVRACSADSEHDSVVFDGLPALVRELTIQLLVKPAYLRAEELRFLRKVSERRAVDFSGLLGVTPEHLSRLENSHAQIPRQVEHAARVLVSVLLSRHRTDLPDCINAIIEADKSPETECQYRFRRESDGRIRAVVPAAVEPCRVVAEREAAEAPVLLVCTTRTTRLDGIRPADRAMWGAVSKQLEFERRPVRQRAARLQGADAPAIAEELLH